MLNVTKSDAFYTCMGVCVCVSGVFFSGCVSVFCLRHEHMQISSTALFVRSRDSFLSRALSKKQNEVLTEKNKPLLDDSFQCKFTSLLYNC